MSYKFCNFDDKAVVLVDKNMQPAYCDSTSNTCTILQTKNMMNDYKKEKLKSGDSIDKYRMDTKMNCSYNTDGKVRGTPDYTNYDASYSSLDANLYYTLFDIKNVNEIILKTNADKYFDMVSKSFTLIPENQRAKLTTSLDDVEKKKNYEKITLDTIDQNNALLYTSIAVISIFAFLVLVIALYQIISNR